MSPAISDVQSRRGHAAAAALRTEVGLFRLAVAVLAVHVVDDSFVQPASGTTAAGHLVSGLLPLLLLVLAAWGYPRRRPGLRALVAIALGGIGLVAGASGAGYHALNAGPSGADFTGLLAIPAGLLLVVLGLVTLWRTRRLDDRKRWRYPRRLLLSVLAPLTAFFVVFPISLGWLATHAMTATVPKAELGVPYEDVSFTTSDGLRLVGWYVPSRNGAAVIAFPGRNGPQQHTRMLARHGYGVLLFDRRGEGDSDGDSNLFGWGGEKDIYAAIDFLERRSDVDPDRIGGIGFSVGGELMLQAAAESGRLNAVISEGAGTRTLAEELEELPTSDLAQALPMLALKTASVAVFSNTAPPPRLTDLLPRLTAPLLLIWAPNGGNAETMNPEYHRLAGGPASIWEMPDAMHIKGITAQPREYERRVVGFLDAALLDQPAP
ncbi:MAG TPA: alpha/beta fold hydrolase [Actinomycetes bacterium]